MPRGVPARPALATSPSLAHHVAPPIEKNRALPSCPLHSPPSCSLALVLSPAALRPRSAGAPWLTRQSHNTSTLAARHLQPSEHPAPRPSSASSRRPPTSKAIKHCRRDRARQPPHPAAAEQLLAAAGQGQSQAWPRLAMARVSHPLPRHFRPSAARSPTSPAPLLCSAPLL